MWNAEHSARERSPEKISGTSMYMIYVRTCLLFRECTCLCSCRYIDQPSGCDNFEQVVKCNLPKSIELTQGWWLGVILLPCLDLARPSILAGCIGPECICSSRFACSSMGIVPVSFCIRPVYTQHKPGPALSRAEGRWHHC